MNHDLIYCPEDFIRDMEHVKFKKGSTIIKADTVPNYVYVVLNGFAKVMYLNSRGKYIIASQFLKGDFIGEINAICSQKFIFSAVAENDMELIKIPAKIFIERMKTDFRLVQSMVQSQNNRINYLEAYSIVNTTFTLYEKILLFLCCFLSRDEIKKSFTKDYLVSFVGSDIRSINRVLKEMRLKNLIETGNGKITIISLEKLKKEAEEHNIDYQIDFFYDYIL